MIRALTQDEINETFPQCQQITENLIRHYNVRRVSFSATYDDSTQNYTLKMHVDGHQEIVEYLGELWMEHYNDLTPPV